MDQNSPVHQRWVWIIDTVFGLIITFGLQEASKNLSNEWQRPTVEAIKHTFYAICLLSFILYDISIYHLITKKFIFHLNVFSILRYVLDILMAYFLLNITFAFLSPQPEYMVIRILINVSLWHCCALSWHVLAHNEYKMAINRKTVQPHLFYIGIYWLAVYGTLYLGRRFMLPSLSIKADTIMFPFCFAILGVAMHRTRLLLIIFKKTALSDLSMNNPQKSAKRMRTYSNRSYRLR